MKPRALMGLGGLVAVVAAGVFIAVKSSKADGNKSNAKAVTVTAGERRHAEVFAHPALVIVAGIRLDRARTPTATQGTIAAHLDRWSVDEGTWTSSVWRYEPQQ